MPGRTILVGDVHGCLEELELLLDRVRHTARDRVIFVGDLVARGPDSHGVLALVRRLGATSVRGNHENRVLSLRPRPGSHARDVADARARMAGSEHARLAADLDDDEWEILTRMPLWLDLDEHGIRVVHAGVVPGIPVERCPEEALMTMRALDVHGAWTNDKRARPLWGERYGGPPHVVFGHNAWPDPQLHAWASGIDTGCVYGNALTALVLDADEPAPRGKAVRGHLTRVRARRAYARVKS